MTPGDGPRASSPARLDPLAVRRLLRDGGLRARHALSQNFLADPDVLEEVRAIAVKEGKQFQSIIDEALRDFIEKRKRGVPRPDVLTALGESLAEYEVLYKELAK